MSSSLISSIPSIRKIPPLPSASSSKKDRKPEDRLWNTLIRSVYGLAVDPALYTQYARFTPLAGPGSDNWPVMAAATWLWSAPSMPIDGWTAINWWIKFFQWQLGIKESSEVDVLLDVAPGDSGFFEMSEPKSNNYSGMICGSVLGVRLYTTRQLAQKNPDPRVSELHRLSGLWLSRWALIHSLCALPGPLASVAVLGPGSPSASAFPEMENHNSSLPLPNRQINLPILTQDGSRSTPSHIIGDPRQLILAELLDYPSRSHPWPARDPFDYWYLILCRMLKDAGDDFGMVGNSREYCSSWITGDRPEIDTLSAPFVGLKWKPFSLYLFSDGSKLGILPFPINGNTAPIHAGYIRPSSSSKGVDSISCWPWAKPKNQPVGSGRAFVTSLDNGERELTVESQLGSCPSVSLPSGPETILHFTETGLSVERI